MEVVQLRWPAERAQRERLRRQRRPRLLLVDEDARPPSPVDCLEDWIRVPADVSDVKARAASLIARTRRHHPITPTLDAGVLRVGEAWVSLSPLEARLTQLLLDRMDTVVSRDALARAGWPEGTSVRNTLDVHALRLRRRLASVGLTIRTVRARGYLLELSGALQEDVHEAYHPSPKSERQEPNPCNSSPPSSSPTCSTR